MKRLIQSIVLACFAVAAFGAQAPAPPVAAVSLSQDVVERGSRVRVTIPNAPAPTEPVVVRIGEDQVPAQPVPNLAGTFDFDVPVNKPGTMQIFPLGEYPVRIIVNKLIFTPSRPLRVVYMVNSTMTVDNVEFDFFGGRSDRKLNLTFYGKGFATSTKEDNVLFVNNSTRPVVWNNDCDPNQPGAVQATPEIYGTVAGSQQLSICNIPLGGDRTVTVHLQHGDEPFVATTRAVPRGSKGYIIFLSLGVVVLCAWIVATLLRGTRPPQFKNKTLWRSRLLLLDAETDTYSLAKYQFYVWTIAALFGYAYLAFSRVLVQGQYELPDIPGSLPAIVGLGAGTSITSQAITNFRGPKGAGDEEPKFSDLITTGGSVAAERVQHLVWTTVGALGFIFVIAQIAPETINSDTFPKIPEGLMYIMGLSSMGYLAGKLARKPGPVIDEMTITPSQPDEDLGALAPLPAAPAGSQTVKPVDLTQPLLAAQQALTTTNATLAPLTEASAPVAVAEARKVTAALESAVEAANQSKSNFTAEGIAKLTSASTDAEIGAAKAAAEFDRLSQDPANAAATEIARKAAEASQQAAAAAQALAAGVTQAASLSQSAPQTAADIEKAARRIIQMRGRHLSLEATFQINGSELLFRMLQGGAPKLIAIEDETGQKNMAKNLQLIIVPSALDSSDAQQYKVWFGKKNTNLTVTITNPDGQKATVSTSLPPGEVQKQAAGAAVG
jgi:hypothetical protein